jgi:small-conductance mechanosensitive channel
METVFSGESIRVWLDAAAIWLTEEIFTTTTVVYTAMQIPALVGSGFAAWWVHDFIHPVLEARIRRSAGDEHSKVVWLTLISLIFPGLWLAGLWSSISVATHFSWPHHMLRVGTNLLSAWIAIQLAVILVRDPIWSRAVTIVAYSVAALNILGLLDPTLALFDRLAVTLGTLRISLLTILQGVLSLGVLLWAAILLSGILQKHVERLPNLTPSVQVLFGKLLKATLIMLAVVVSLTSVGIDLTAMAVFSGAVGVGIGFGLQKVVSNLISGMILLMDKSIKPGDIIQIGDTYGWIASLGARYVSVETRDGTEFLIPNEDVITQQVINWSHKNKLARLKVRVRVSFNSDVRKALDLMIQAAHQPARVLRHPEPKALLLGFGDSALDLELRFWICDVQNGIRNVSSDVMLEIWDLFRQHDIHVPFPQRDIHLHPAQHPSVATRHPSEATATPQAAE